MKIGFSVMDNKGANSLLDSRFGRAGGFMVYDNENGSWHWLDNTQNVHSVSGAGIQAAQTMINAGISVFIGVHLGPKAFVVFNQAEIKLYQGTSGLSVQENLDQYEKGLLNIISEANSVGF